ncbi:hypothetical protein, partial [Bradyrhizobium sp. 164]|uniref:hypothetical protein n=1 Tax=Bradyrhizobium sp. 164 TaxID=2782637 RepID=UPI001FFBC25B
MVEDGVGLFEMEKVPDFRHHDTLKAICCQSAFDWDPLSASKRDPFDRRALLGALGSSELV